MMIKEKVMSEEEDYIWDCDESGNKKSPKHNVIMLETNIHPRCHSTWSIDPLSVYQHIRRNVTTAVAVSPYWKFVPDCPRKSIPSPTPYRNPTACGSLCCRSRKCTPLSQRFSLLSYSYLNTAVRFCQDILPWYFFNCEDRSEPLRRTGSPGLY